tara:strand:- start:348 stop:929 length:582 start_codon:yes stop_codon:yes gene_type:complete
MRSIPKKLIPVTLLTVLSSTFMYGTLPYIVTTRHGGPLQDEYEIISRAETQNQYLHITATIIHEGRSQNPSEWTDDQQQDLFPEGSKTVTVLFTIMNTSPNPVNLYDMTINAVFTESEYHAAQQTPTRTATHTQLGYPEQYADLFNETNNWVLSAGKYVQFAATYYTEPSNELNITINVPTAQTEEQFTLLTN